MEEEKNQIQDEINLMDYLKVILKRKWLIFIVFLGAMIAAGVFSFTAPKIYRIDTLFEIGSIDRVIIEEPVQLVEKIKEDIYGILVRERLKIPEEKYPEIRAKNLIGTRLIEMTIESSDTKEAKNILKEINRIILEEHQEKIKTEKGLLEKNIERLKTKVASLEEEKKNLKAQIEIFEMTPLEEQSPASQFAFFSTKERLEAKKQEIENTYLQINGFKRYLEDIQSTKAVKSPVISEEPIKPRPVLNIVIAAVLGLFVGVFLAFGKEWWQKESKISLARR